MKLLSTILPLSALSILGGCFLAPSTQGAPLVSIGDSVDVFFNGSAGVRWTSNLFRDDDDEIDDIVWTLSPGFEVNVGRGASNADFSVITSYDILRYDERDDLDVELFDISAVGSYKASRWDMNGSLGYSERQTTTGDTNVQTDDLITSDRYRGRLEGEYRVSPKFSFGSGVRYAATEYTSFEGRFNDRTNYKVPLDVFYELTPKVDLSLGYQYGLTEVDGRQRIFDEGTPDQQTLIVQGYETDTHFLNVGARGNLLPKLNGFFKVGFRTRDSESTTDRIVGSISGSRPLGPNPRNRDGNDGMLGLDADFTWSATPKLTTALRLSRDFGVAGDGNATENTSVDVNASYSLSPKWALSGNLGYTLREYQDDDDREDDQYRAGLRASYRMNEHWRFSTGYAYDENASNEDPNSYEVHSLNFTASLRY